MSKIILKISGESLKEEEENVSKNKLERILKLVNLLKSNHDVAIVIGGGNFFRGRNHPEMDKVTADTIGIFSSIINSLYLKDYLNSHNVECTLATPFNVPNLIDNLSDAELKDNYNNGKIIIFGGGVGKSGYSTDSGTILALEKIDADLIIKLTNVDGVYSEDPKVNKEAIKYDYLTYDDVLEKDLKVMDAYAIKKCQELNTKILVMNFNDYEKIIDYFKNKKIGTIIGG